MDKAREARQTRTFNSRFAAREADGGRRVEGYFAVFGSVYDLWPGATESIDPHAFDGALDDDIRCLMESVNRSEFFAGGKAGFRPEMVFTIFHGEYRGEDTLTWNGTAYAIYRTFHRPGTDDLELYVKREVGVDNGAQDGD